MQFWHAYTKLSGYLPAMNRIYLSTAICMPKKRDCAKISQAPVFTENKIADISE